MPKPHEMTNDEIDDLVDKWHKSIRTCQLHEFLGWTQEEYAAWVADPSICRPDPQAAPSSNR